MALEKKQEMAVMRNVQFGMDDRDNVTLRFDARLANSLASGLSLDVDTTVKMLKFFECSDINDLDGKHIMVEHEGLGGIMKYVEPINI